MVPHSYPIVSPQNARDAQQRAELEENLRTGKCPFCPGGSVFDRATVLPTLTTEVTAIYNTWPHENAAKIDGRLSQHWVHFPHQCLADREALANPEWNDILCTLHDIDDTYDIGNQLYFYGRSGDPALACTTITHVHFQTMVVQPGAMVPVFFGPFHADAGTQIIRLHHSPQNDSGLTEYWPPFTTLWKVRKFPEETGLAFHWLISPTMASDQHFPLSYLMWEKLLETLAEFKESMGYTASHMVGSLGSNQFHLFLQNPGYNVRVEFQG